MIQSLALFGCFWLIGLLIILFLGIFSIDYIPSTKEIIIQIVVLTIFLIIIFAIAICFTIATGRCDVC